MTLNNEVAKIDRKSTGPKGIALADILDLAEKNLTNAEMGKLLGCSAQAISKRLKVFGPKLRLLKSYKKHRADMLTLKQAEIFETLTPSKIAEAPLSHAVNSMRILHEQERLERGLSTANVANKTNIEVIDNRPDLQAAVSEALKELGLSTKG